ncbi:Hypothetical predicted protein [Paramuricea clavata]|uniref:Uncharacterized protein n=1 Tax=Paramuricea clavata TaxID=317549 RepID=A0A6S7GGX1_PARCT|nr:Hypothetical predicted protein [Paramuricea clavata]
MILRAEFLDYQAAPNTELPAYFDEDDKPIRIASISEDKSAISLKELPNETLQQHLTGIGGIRDTEGVQTAERKSIDADVDVDGSGSLYSPSVVVSTNVCKKSGSKLFTDEENECFKNTFKSLMETNQSISQKCVRQKMEAKYYVPY